MKNNQTQKQAPKDWREVKLGNVGTTYGGLTGKDKADFGTGKPFVSYMDVYGSGAMRKLPTSLVKVGDGERQNIVQYGDVVFTTSSETADEVGTASVFLAKSSESVYLNSFCFGFRIDHEVLSPEYAQFFFRATPFRRDMARIAQGATRYNLSKSHFLQTGIALPPLPEQKRIVKMLEAWDRAIELVERKIALKREVKKGIMQRLLTGKVRLPGFSGEWRKVSLTDISEINPANGTLPDEFIYIDLEAVKQGVLVKKQEVKRIGAPSRAQRLLTKGDILFQMVRPYQMNNLYFEEDGRFVASTGYAQIRTNGSAVFLYYLLHLPVFVGRVLARCTGSSYPAINSTDLGKIHVFVPEKKEQAAIGDVLYRADTDIKLLQQKLTLLKDQRKYLLNNLVTGAIRTPETI